MPAFISIQSTFLQEPQTERTSKILFSRWLFIHKFKLHKETKQQKNQSKKQEIQHEIIRDEGNYYYVWEDSRHPLKNGFLAGISRIQSASELWWWSFQFHFCPCVGGYHLYSGVEYLPSVEWKHMEAEKPSGSDFNFKYLPARSFVQVTTLYSA